VVRLVRVFIAVEIENPEVLNKLVSIKKEIESCGGKGVKPVEDENIHLTIRFIGEVPESYLPRIRECMDMVRHVKHFTMTIAGIGAFPNPARPRVIWAGVVNGIKELKEIRAIADRCLRGIAQPDRHGFSPHITLARVKGRVGPCMRDLIERYTDTIIGDTPVTKVVLKQSRLTPKGPIYTDLYAVNLE
jgi:2'-5' RNA ligase